MIKTTKEDLKNYYLKDVDEAIQRVVIRDNCSEAEALEFLKEFYGCPKYKQEDCNHVYRLWCESSCIMLIVDTPSYREYTKCLNCHHILKIHKQTITTNLHCVYSPCLGKVLRLEEEEEEFETDRFECVMGHTF